MQHYSTTAALVTSVTSNTGQMYQSIDPYALAQFKNHIETHMQTLTTEVRILRDHANWIEPRLRDFHEFMGWMQIAHPDIIEAYTKSKQVAEKLDRANNTEMEHIQVAVSA